MAKALGIKGLIWVDMEAEGDIWRVIGTTAVHDRNGMEIKSVRPANRPQCKRARKAMEGAQHPSTRRKATDDGFGINPSWTSV